MLPAFETSEGFCFLFEFLYNFDFRRIKPIQALFSRFCLLEIIVRLSISLMAKLSV